MQHLGLLLAFVAAAFLAVGVPLCCIADANCCGVEEAREQAPCCAHCDPEPEPRPDPANRECDCHTEHEHDAVLHGGAKPQLEPAATAPVIDDAQVARVVAPAPARVVEVGLPVGGSALTLPLLL